MYIEHHSAQKKESEREKEKERRHTNTRAHHHTIPPTHTTASMAQKPHYSTNSLIGLENIK